MTEKTHLLFVCTANQHRSRTAEDLFEPVSGVAARSAGTDVHPNVPEERPLTRELLEWADVVYAMEPYHRRAIEERFPDHGRRIVVLGIEDRYLRGERELVRLLREKLDDWLL